VLVKVNSPIVEALGYSWKCLVENGRKLIVCSAVKSDIFNTTLIYI